MACRCLGKGDTLAKSKTSNPVICPECGCDRSYKAMEQGEAKRRCVCCRVVYADPRNVKPVKTDEAEE